MELQGSVTLTASTEQVWQALNNPEVLRLCIPGCEEVRQISPEEMHARVVLKLGPVRASFVGKVRLTDVRPLQGCTLNFEGSGGSAGFAKGSSVIVLTAVPEGTRLDYNAQAAVAGKLGQVGGRLMDASVRQMADRFFAAFKTHIAAGSSPSLAVPVSPTGSGELSGVAQSGMTQARSAPSGWFAIERPRLLWFAAGVAATSIGVWIGAHWLR